MCRPPAHAALPVLLFAAAVACSPAPPGEEVLEDVQVGEGPTETLTVDEDQQGQLPSSGGRGLTGVLPTDFPADVPLPLPADITDLGMDDTRRYVEVSVQRPLEDVRADVNARLRGSGWQQQGQSYSKGARTIDVAVSGSRGSARVRIDYTRALEGAPRRQR